MRLRREAENKRTTYYTCCTEAHPNTFTFSDPAEAAWMSYYSSKKHLTVICVGHTTAGHWSRCSIPASAVGQAEILTLVYPGARSCIRFERLIEGIQAHEKINILRQEFEKNGNKAGLKKIEKNAGSVQLG